MKRLWPVLLLLLPLGVAVPFLPLRRLAWRWLSEDGTQPYLRSTVWFMSRQQPEGCWDEGPATIEGHSVGRPGTTGLALLTFLGAGYSQLSKDRYEWYDVGRSVRGGLEWLIRDQRPDGTFRSAAGLMDSALATLALSEAYGLTANATLKTPSQKGVDALAEQILAGDLRDDPALHGWAAMTLWSAEISGLTFKAEAMDRIRTFYDAQTEPADPREILTRILVDKNRTHPRIAPGIARLASRPPDWPQQDFAAWYWGSAAMFQHDGASGPLWKAWEDPLKTTLVPSQASRGDWTGRNRGDTFVRTAQASLTLMVYYRYANVFGTAK